MTPQQGQLWKHYKGTEYLVVGIANEGNAADDDNNPPIVAYRAWNADWLMPEGKLYARLLSKWNGSFTLVK